MDAPGALDSFLGRLTAVLVNEAQLLGRVRGDVEFIKDEMESMNGLILHLTEAQHRDHQVRAWMKQVVGLTRDCEGNVELYVHYVGSRPGDDGLLGHIRRVLRFLRTIPVRHRIATRIQELKVRARDVGDRRQRYGVTVPASTTTTNIDVIVDMEPAAKEEEDLGRRSILLYGAEPPYSDEVGVVRRGIHTLATRLSMDPATEDNKDGAPPPQLRVFSILGSDLAREVAEGVYQQQHSSQATLLCCKAFWKEDVGRILTKILEQVGDVQPFQPGQAANQAAKKRRLISKLQGHLKGKRFLIELDVNDHFTGNWKRILDALLQAADGCLPGSAIIVTTSDYDRAQSSSPYKIINARGTRYKYEYEYEFDFYTNQARNLQGATNNSHNGFFQLCESDTFAMKTFLHLLYFHPNRTEQELQNYKNTIEECRRLKRSISMQVLLWCYNELPSKYRSCLLYLTVFPEGHVIRTRSLARRWVAEGLITATTTSTPTDDEIQRSSTDEAEHCLDVLFTRGFVSPVEISAEGNIKSCTVHRQVREFIARVAMDVNFVDSSLPPHLARYLSIHSRIGLQKPLSDGDSKDIAAYLPYLSVSPQWQLLKVLDLEGCKGLNKKKILKSICKILLLKYLSLRNTDVTQLPKQIKDLRCLETLDVRQTKVRIFTKKAIVLRLLKHFLAGDKTSVSNDAGKCEESFSAVDMPLGIQRMNNLEILSHVQVTDSSSELTGIAELQKLRKLGVALRGPNAKLSDLFHQIDRLHKCLRSLSVRFHQQAFGEKHDALTPPNFITSLNVSGLTSGLPHMIQELHQLVKLTLTETYLKKDGLCILGKLRGLNIYLCFC
ncbi:hypothetical protein BDA96_05G220100 [Sorghum bicolor]|uniref:Rx N-terminal domain-containing protein n=1 Tax=Sorghum bicolor TaxID=4558 RepID=A0A921QZE8_SORBI|nr:hypothetical protein BDA96_05G220100 [Sorghum bicolor]